MSDDPFLMVQDYSAALDELFALRTLLAHEGRVVNMALTYRSLPARVRRDLEATAARIDTAVHNAVKTIEAIPSEQRRIDRAMYRIPGLTSHSWREELMRRSIPR